jgi:DNA-binding GntR family transcriptional regulator
VKNYHIQYVITTIKLTLCIYIIDIDNINITLKYLAFCGQFVNNHGVLSINDDRFQKINPERRVQQVFNQLQHAIYTAKLLPGELLREAVLARDLGVSQATVREALTKLEHLYLVVRTPNRRTEVKNLTRAELKDRIQVRVALETRAFTQALENGWNESNFQQLEQLAGRIFEDPVGDLKFHRYIWDRSGNAVLLQTLLQVSACLFGFVSILREAKLQDAKSRVESHKNLIEGLRKEDTNEIEGAVRKHMESAYARFFEKDYPDFQSLARQLWRRQLSPPRQLSPIELGELVSLAPIGATSRPI